MDITKLFGNVDDLDKYVKVTQDIETKLKNYKCRFNMSTVLFMKKMRTFEIEYFNMYGNSGAAIKIFELMLHFPPSQTWSILGKDLISLLQYWLSFLHNHLIVKNKNWWSFLCKLLELIKGIRLKESTLSNILVEQIAETILSIVTQDIPNISQKYIILCTFNLCGADCNRKIRFALRTQFDYYFTTLAKILATCGDVALQYSIIDTLLRWLVPRNDNNVRLEAATKWLPDYLYSRNVVKLFLERTWTNFFQDARDFLNMHNECNDLITSVIIKKFKIGNVVLVTGLEKRENWLDINTGSKCMSLILSPCMINLLGHSDVGDHSFENLIISETNTSEVKLRRSAQVVITVAMLKAPYIIPSSVTLTGEGYDHMEITISPDTDLARTVQALRRIFANKFQEGDTFTRPELKKGCMVKRINIGQNLTSSSASTSSLAQLHQKLAALPKTDYYKKPVSVCIAPGLSNVTEVTEAEDHNSPNASKSTLRNRYCGVSHKRNLCNNERETEVNEERGHQADHIKCVSSSGTQKEKPVSCLLVASIGSTDDSIINDTLERLSKSKSYTTDNVLDLLFQEAIENEVVAYENVEAETKLSNENKPHKKCTVISNSTSAEEFNTDVVEGTQFSNVNFEKRSHRHRTSIQKNNPLELHSPIKTFDEKIVEEFFSQHFYENPDGEINISSTLANKINGTSLECSELFTKCCSSINIDPDVLECINFIVNKICDEYDQCDNILNQDLESICLQENTVPEKTNHSDTLLLNEVLEKSPSSSNKKSIKPVILKFKTINKPSRKITSKKNLDQSSPKSSVQKKIMDKENSKSNVRIAETVKREKRKKLDESTELLRKKRKLYSPKTQHWNNDENIVLDANEITKTNPKTTCYEEIEKERKDYTKKLRIRKQKKVDLPPISPRTKKANEAFDKIKEQQDDNANGILADRNKNDSVFNFISDSDSEDFKKSKINQTGSTAKRKTDMTFVKSKSYKKSYPGKKNNQSNKIRKGKPVRTVVDERMRDQLTDILNTSLDVQNPPQGSIKDFSLNLKTKYEMEFMNEDVNKSVENIPKDKVSKTKTKAKKAPSLKRKKIEVNNESIILNETNDRTLSPFPVLLVENVSKKVDTSNDSITAMNLNKSDRHEKRYETIESDSNTTKKEQKTPINKATEKPIKKHIISKNNASTIESQDNIVYMDGGNSLASDTSRCSQNKLERSIRTVGYSPITAHGDLDLCQKDLPPSRELLYKSIEPRNLEVDDLNQSLKEFYVLLNKEIVKEATCGDDDLESSRSSVFSHIASKLEERTKSPILSFSRDTSKQLPSNSESCYVNLERICSEGNRDNDINKLKKSTAKTSETKFQKRPYDISQISPVKLFEDLKLVTKRTSISSKSTNATEERSNRTRFYKKQSAKIESPRRSNNYWLRDKRDRDSNAEVVAVASTSKKKSPSKRKSQEELSQRSKKKSEGEDHRRVSVETVSGINMDDWFRSMELATSKEATLDMHKDNMSYIIERLDTMVSEIHHNTDKRFINMFVKAQSQLDANKEQRNELFRTTARELFSDMVKMIDARFADMNAKSDEMDKKFMAELKQLACDVITDDCAKKKAIVKMLREDVQAVVDFMNKDK